MNPEWIDYINGLTISSKTKNDSIAFLKILNKMGIPIPNIAPGPDRMVGFSWRDFNKELYTSMEIFPDGRLAVFQENLVTGELSSVEFGNKK